MENPYQDQQPSAEIGMDGRVETRRDSGKDELPNEATNHEPFAAWAILELMGHRRLAGFVQEVEVAGHGMLRIDIPAEIPTTQYYSVGSVYCMTPTTEAIARRVAAGLQPEPVHRWELPPPTNEEKQEIF